MKRPYKLLIYLAVVAVIGVLLSLYALKGSVSQKKEAVASEKKLSKVLNVYNWEEYFGETTLADFEKTFGVKVNLETFLEEEELLAMLRSRPDKYDVVITSDDSIATLVEMRLLAEIDMGNIPNIKNIDARFQEPHYDPGHKHSVPYLWGTTGIVVNRKFVKESEASWSILWNPKYRGKTAMLDSPNELLGAGLKYLGYSLNAVDPSQLEEARQKLLEQSDLITGYLDVIAIRDKAISNELWAAQVYSGEALFAMDKNEDLDYIIPKEGASVWTDCLAIPRDAKHKHTAEVFINYILDPKVSAEIVNYLWYANCNEAARAYTKKEILESPALYPSEEILRRCEYFLQMGTEEERIESNQSMYEIWSELRLRKKTQG